MFILAIADADGHHVTVALIIQAQLSLSVSLDTLRDQLLFDIHTRRRKGRRRIIPSK